jgi:hypothetical protein
MSRALRQRQRHRRGLRAPPTGRPTEAWWVGLLAVRYRASQDVGLSSWEWGCPQRPGNQASQLPLRPMRHLGSEVLELFDQRESHVSYEDQALLVVDSSDGRKVAMLVRGE